MDKVKEIGNKSNAKLRRNREEGRLTDYELDMVEGKRGQFVNESYRREGVNNKTKGGNHE